MYVCVCVCIHKTHNEDVTCLKFLLLLLFTIP